MPGVWQSVRGLPPWLRVLLVGQFVNVTYGGITAFDPDGTLIGKIKVPEVVANCTFGGAKRNVLYICGTTSLYAVRVMVSGAKVY